jgi:16S rRNA (adenine1518-N6/adenine1519-N6)-dimethyltransferase
MINEAKIQPNDHVLEIGGGIGILTNALHKTQAKVTVIEQDRKLGNFLKDTYKNVEIIIGDALKVEWPKNVRVISNLPYSISSPLLVKILHHSSIDAMIMLQKEVAMRCIAAPGSKNYSRLSIVCQLHSNVRKILDVSPDAFIPAPKVQSQVIHLQKKEQSLVADHQEIELLTRNLFSLRRRTVRAVIRGFLKRKQLARDLWDLIPHKDKRVLDLSLEMIEEILNFLKENQAWPLA